MCVKSRMKREVESRGICRGGGREGCLKKSFCVERVDKESESKKVTDLYERLLVGKTHLHLPFVQLE